MNEISQIILYTACAGACIPLGGLLAYNEKFRPRWLENEFRHSVIAFGGGILIAAVALVLVPEGNTYVSQPIFSVMLLLAGGVCFFLVESVMGARRRQKPQFMAMLLDFIPETLALGGIFALGSHTAPLLALFIGLQNLPEGFNSYRELRSMPNSSSRRIFLLMLLLIPVGPVVAMLGYLFLSQYTFLLGAIMLFASGGILYLIFQDIAPQARMQRHWAPPLGAVLGFCVGMLGNNFVAGP
ncbi:MAG: divalent cation transporter [Gammaproteobacteria bacterium]|nr:divalent cation transporter [Gammaproteobacteria bacterium]